MMPPFQSQTLSGNQVISAGYDGHTVVVSFVSAKCESCERVLSAAQASYAEEREVVVVGVFRPDEDAANVRSMAARLELRFPIVVDHGGTLARRFQIEDVPRTFVIDRAGRVRWVGGQDVTEDGLLAAIHAAD
jgi:peroxiredoxin